MLDLLLKSMGVDQKAFAQQMEGFQKVLQHYSSELASIKAQNNALQLQLAALSDQLKTLPIAWPVANVPAALPVTNVPPPISTETTSDV